LNGVADRIAMHLIPGAIRQMAVTARLLGLVQLGLRRGLVLTDALDEVGLAFRVVFDRLPVLAPIPTIGLLLLFGAPARRLDRPTAGQRRHLHTVGLDRTAAGGFLVGHRPFDGTGAIPPLGLLLLDGPPPRLLRRKVADRNLVVGGACPRRVLRLVL